MKLPFMLGNVDRAGNPISYRTYLWLFEDHRNRVVKQTTVGDVFVSTIWIGQNKCAVFETMVEVDGEWTGDQYRRSTEREAVRDHDDLVEALNIIDRTPHDDLVEALNIIDRVIRKVES